MSYDRIGVIGAMDSELAALIKKPDKTDKSVFSVVFDGYDPIASGGLPPLALPRCTLVFTKQAVVLHVYMEPIL